ncbi:MAG TPA: DUF429 domain-containing protein [Candidatus Sulfotelmatobacter sp.]|nr:DUF429 domain-containing protein [Candidatus Sulfotelmatobacter sp.]
MPNVPNEQAVRFLGLDLAWSERNGSGLAALDGNGRLIEARVERWDNAAIGAWIVGLLAGRAGAIAIDMPTIVRNREGSRACERDLGRDFHRHQAGAHPANLRRFAGPGRAHRLLAELARDGVVHTRDVEPFDRRAVAFEVYPHPAMIRLFGLCTTIKYKKKNRPWPSVLAEWGRYRRHLATLASADPPLVLDDALLADEPQRERYKSWDDRIDGVFCAYLAAWVWRHGTTGGKVCTYGALRDGVDHGHILVPNPTGVHAGHHCSAALLA